MTWYQHLAKPAVTPSPATIGMIWSALYPVILLTFGFVFVQAFRRKVEWSRALPFAVNLVANILFMPIFSGLRNLSLATIDIGIVWLSLIWCCFAIWPKARWVAFAQVPYFIWVTIAMMLQISITVMNWNKV